MASFASQARRDVRQAYRPAFKSLNKQERRVRALDRKQRKDERAFQSWLKDTNAALNAEAAQRDAQLQQVTFGYDQQMREAFGQSTADSQARSAAVGHGTLAGHATADPARDAQVQALQGYGIAQAAAFGQRGAESQRRGIGLSLATEKNSYAFVAQQRAQRRATILDAISKIAEQRGDLRAKQAADVAKRQADLEGAAAEAAQQQFQNSIAMERLANEQARIAQGDARLDLSAAGQSERLRQGRVRNQLARRRLTQGGSRGPTRTPAQRQANQSLYDTALANATDFYRRARRGEARVRPGDHARLTNWLLRGAPRGFTRDMAAAAAWQVIGGRISKSTRRKLARQGIRVG